MTDNDLTLITSPDFVHNDANSILLVCPRIEYTNQILKRLEEFDSPFNVYVHTNPENDDIKWMMSAFNACDTCFVDVDNCDDDTKLLISKLISNPKTFWLTNTHSSVYNIISVNGIHSLEILFDIIGDKIEK